MMMTMIVINKHVDGADCCLIGIVLGVTMKKISCNGPVSANIAQYPITQYQYRIVVLTLVTCLQ